MQRSVHCRDGKIYAKEREIIVVIGLKRSSFSYHFSEFIYIVPDKNEQLAYSTACSLFMHVLLRRERIYHLISGNSQITHTLLPAPLQLLKSSPYLIIYSLGIAHLLASFRHFQYTAEVFLK